MHNSWLLQYICKQQSSWVVLLKGWPSWNVLPNYVLSCIMASHYKGGICCWYVAVIFYISCPFFYFFFLIIIIFFCGALQFGKHCHLQKLSFMLFGIQSLFSFLSSSRSSAEDRLPASQLFGTNHFEMKWSFHDWIKNEEEFRQKQIQ